MWLSIACRGEPIELCADGLNDFKISSLRVAAEAVGRSRTSALQGERNTGAMVFDMNPVANVATISVNRERLPGKRPRNSRWNQLLWILARSVVVRTIRRDGRQALGVMPGPDQEVGRCF